MVFTERRRVIGLCLAGLALGMSGCDGGAPAIQRLSEARSLVASLQIELRQATGASTLAVLALTDEASVAFATKAETARKALHRDIDALAPLLAGLAYDEESKALNELIERLASYEELDRTMLALAVENTNLKAQKLSFGAAKDAANGFRGELETILKAAPAETRCDIAALFSSAVLAVREVQVIHAEHIAEPDDQPMSRMEKEMDARLTLAAGALGSLSNVVTGDSKPGLAAARGAFDRFKAVHTQIVDLSRRNSNVRSTSLALGEMQTLASACEASLELLSSALARRGATATR